MRHGKVKVYSWSKHGWAAKEATPEKKKQLTSVRCRMPYVPEEFNDTRPKAPDLALLSEATNQIQIGTADDAMDNLPNYLKQMLRAPDVWHIANGKIMRIVDPITQAKDGEWGADNTEGDIEVLDDNRSAIRMLLEDCHVVKADDSTEEYQDIMGQLLETNNGEIIPSSPMVRANIGVQFVGEEDETADDNYDTDDTYVTQFVEPTPIVPQISDSVLEQIQSVRDEYLGLLADVKDEKEQEVLMLTMEQKIDSIASRELCNKLDSPYCGYKYSPPRRKHEFIISGQESHLTEAAARRVKFFYDLMSEATSCKSTEALHGPIVEEIYIDEWTQEEKVRKGRPGGFMGMIREMYQIDKELACTWSMNGPESEFNVQRQEFIRALREKGKDEETVRKSTWAWFDRVQGTVPAVYKDGRLVQESKKWKDSIWRQKRTEAMKDLYLTKAQWNAIYKMVGIQKERIKLNYHTDENERKAIDILQKHFKRIETLKDLSAYRKWAKKREFIYKSEYKTYIDEDGKERKQLVSKWNTYDFKRSVVDYLSTKNANRWWKGLLRKKKYLENKLALFNKLDESIKSVEDTGIEASLVCPYSNCDNMAVGNLIFAKLEDDKGHLFVECECGKKVWAIAHKESGSDIKTKEEATNAYCTHKR